ncbi:MAG: methionyl-tRNA formyltransferase, partial [Chloroflexi bacterium]|nr:methionyl-tRNA formyltransferase [Chloroflexota bacterium]
MSPARTVFLGTGRFGLETLWRLADHPAVDLVGIITAPARPAGRHGNVSASPIGMAAEELGVSPIFTPERLRAPESVDAILALEPELAVLADYGQIVPPGLLGLRHGALNLHPSLLPRHRGATPIPATILADDRETGVTLIRMDAGLDTGPIVGVGVLPLGGAETTPELEERLAMLAATVLQEQLEPWIAGAITPKRQDEADATLTTVLHRQDGRLDPMRPAVELERRIRALLPWPGTFLELDRVGRLIVRSAVVVPAEAGDEPGLIVADVEGLALTTGDGRLRLG